MRQSSAGGTGSFRNHLAQRFISFTNFNAQFLYSLTIRMLHYDPRHVSSINMPIFRRTNCIITASGIITLCKRLYSMPDESSLLSSGILYCRLQSDDTRCCGNTICPPQVCRMRAECSHPAYCTAVYRVTIQDAVIIQFVLLKMGMLMLETCRGL